MHSTEDETLELVSARFADLIAYQVQQQLLDDLTQKISSLEDETALANALLQALRQPTQDPNLFYLGFNRTPRPWLVVPTRSWLTPVNRSLIMASASALQGPEILQLALAGQACPRAGLRLCDPQANLLALICFSRDVAGPTAHPALGQFLQQLAQRIAPLLANMRLRQQLRAAQPLHLPNLLDDWNPLLQRLQESYSQLEHVLDNAVATLGGEKGSLMLLDESSGDLVVRATVGLNQEVQEAIRRGEHPCRRLKVGQGVAGSVVQTLEPLVVQQVEDNPLFLEPQLSQVSSIICLPLAVEGMPLGVINITNRHSSPPLQIQALEEGLRLAAQASYTVHSARLQRLALLDPVAEVYSRSHLFQRCQEEIIRARRYQRNLCLLAIALEGEEVPLADILRRCLRETDALARLGPHRLAVLMPETDAVAGMFAAERICQQIRENLISQKVGGATVGVCSFPDRCDGARVMISRAEQALDQALCSSEHLPVVLAPPLDHQQLMPVLRTPRAS